jgi:hypothetical protein
MTLATGVVGLVVVSDRQARAAAADVVDRATLESATEAALFGLERDGVPQTNEWTDRQTLNGLDVTLTFAAPSYKPDLNQSTTDAIAAAIADPALSGRAAAAFAPPSPTDHRPQFKRFIDFVKAAGADAAGEDCLRRRLTIGRQSGETDPLPEVTTIAPPRAPLGRGDVVDVRAELRDWTGRRMVLWRRVRFTGNPETPWLAHDWRELRLPRTDSDCPLVRPAPTVGPSLNIGGNSAARP